MFGLTKAPFALEEPIRRHPSPLEVVLLMFEGKAVRRKLLNTVAKPTDWVASETSKSLRQGFSKDTTTLEKRNLLEEQTAPRLLDAWVRSESGALKNVGT